MQRSAYPLQPGQALAAEVPRNIQANASDPNVVY